MDGSTATAPPPVLARPRPDPASAHLPPPGRPRGTCLDLGALASAVPCARGHARNVLAEWGIRDGADTIELVVSELITNALQATAALTRVVPSSVRLRLADDRPFVLVEVGDDAPARPARQTPEDAAEHGRGLMIVHAVSAEWGTYPVAGAGKIVWARVRCPSSQAAGSPRTGW